MRICQRSGLALRILAGALFGLGIVWWFGCTGAGGTGDINSILTGQVQDLLNQLGVDPNTVNIRIINQTSYSEQIDIRTDGLPQTLTCSSIQGVCDFPLPACPQTIETVEERKLDTSGRFQGGRIFHGNANFIFTQAEGEFQCGSIIVFTITDASIEVNIL